MSSGKTTLWSPASGDIALPITESTVDAALGSNTPASAVVTTLHATGATELDGAVTGAGFVAAVQAIVEEGLTEVGTFTANGVTPVTVADTSITANSLVLITLKTVGGTVGAIPHVETITPGTGFTVIGTALDTSVYNYGVIG